MESEKASASASAPAPAPAPAPIVRFGHRRVKDRESEKRIIEECQKYYFQTSGDIKIERYVIQLIDHTLLPAFIPGPDLGSGSIVPVINDRNNRKEILSILYGINSVKLLKEIKMLFEDPDFQKGLMVYIKESLNIEFVQTKGIIDYQLEIINRICEIKENINAAFKEMQQIIVDCNLSTDDISVLVDRGFLLSENASLEELTDYIFSMLNNDFNANCDSLESDLLNEFEPESVLVNGEVILNKVKRGFVTFINNLLSIFNAYGEKMDSLKTYSNGLNISDYFKSKIWVIIYAIQHIMTGKEDTIHDIASEYNINDEERSFIIQYILNRSQKIKEKILDKIIENRSDDEQTKNLIAKMEDLNKGFEAELESLLPSIEKEYIKQKISKDVDEFISFFQDRGIAVGFNNQEMEAFLSCILKQEGVSSFLQVPEEKLIEYIEALAQSKLKQGKKEHSTDHQPKKTSSWSSWWLSKCLVGGLYLINFIPVALSKIVMSDSNEGFEMRVHYPKTLFEYTYNNRHFYYARDESPWVWNKNRTTKTYCLSGISDVALNEFSLVLPDGIEIPITSSVNTQKMPLIPFKGRYATLYCPIKYSDIKNILEELIDDGYEEISYKAQMEYRVTPLPLPPEARRQYMAAGFTAKCQDQFSKGYPVGDIVRFIVRSGLL